MYGGQCVGYYTQSLISLPNVLNANGIDMSYTAMFNESLIQRARNALVHGFMKNENCTHLMFIDADIGFTPAQVFRLLTADRDVVGGAYPIKHYDWPRVARDLRDGVPEAPAYM